MSTLDKRETAAETKFVKDEEQAFARSARLRKLLALWAAEKMGMDSDQGTSYANALLHDYFNITVMMDKIADDFAEAGLSLSKEQIMEERSNLEEQISAK